MLLCLLGWEDEFSGNNLVCRSVSKEGTRKIWMGFREESLEDFTFKPVQGKDSVRVIVMIIRQDGLAAISSPPSPQNLPSPKAKIVEVVRLGQILNIL